MPSEQLARKFDRMVQKIKGWITGEEVILLILIGASAFLLYGSRDFSTGGRVFPIMTSVITIIGSLLLIFKKYLPETFREAIVEDPEEDIVDELDELSEDENKRVFNEPETIAPMIPNDIAIMGLLVGYAVASYLITMFIATPLFVLIYSVWFKQPWYMIVGLTVTSVLIALGFDYALHFPIDRGVFIDELPFLQVI